MHGDSWGDPSRIDDLYLQPVDPPDLLGLPDTEPSVMDPPLQLANRKISK